MTRDRVFEAVETSVSPYRSLPESPPPPCPRMPAEDRFLIGLLVVIGGIRFFGALFAGAPLDAEPTLALAMLVLGVGWGLRWRGACKRTYR